MITKKRTIIIEFILTDIWSNIMDKTMPRKDKPRIIRKELI